MKIKIVNVLFQVEVEDSRDDLRKKLKSFLEDSEETTDQPLYEGADALVVAMLKNASKFGIGMKDHGKTPQHDFDLSLHFKVVDKTIK